MSREKGLTGHLPVADFSKLTRAVSLSRARGVFRVRANEAANSTPTPRRRDRRPLVRSLPAAAPVAASNRR